MAMSAAKVLEAIAAGRAQDLLGQEVLIPIALIRPYAGQPRKKFREATLIALGKGMKRRKQVQPAKVKIVTGDPQFSFELIDGERRWRACKAVGIETLCCVVSEVSDEAEQRLDALIANFAKEDHTPREKALAFKREIDAGWTQSALAEVLSLTQPVLSNYLRLLDLHPKLQELLEEDDEEKALPPSVGYVLATLAIDHQLKAWDQIKHSRNRTTRARAVVQQMLKAGAARHPNSRERHVRPATVVRSLERLIIKTAGSLDDMSKIDWRAMLRSTPADRRRTLSLALNDMEQTVLNLVKQLREALPKAG